MQRSASWYDLAKEKQDGTAQEYPLPAEQVRILMMESFANAGWAAEQHKTTGNFVSVKGNEGGSGGAGSAVIWFDPGSSPSSTLVTVRSDTHMILTGGEHPMTDKNIHARIGAAVKAYEAKKAAGMAR
jgi:hypothetical protein